MQKLVYVLYQIDEARRYLEGGRVEQLRLALLLLDNAAELQVATRAGQELMNENTREGVRARVLEIPEEHRGRAGTQLTDWEPLTAGQKRRLERYFDEKLKHLTGRWQILDERLAKVLSYLHQYRNEAYHEGHVRYDTIRTAAAILLEANCQLLTTTYRVRMYSSAEDYSWAQERFDLGNRLLRGKDLERIADDLRTEVVPTTDSLAETLRDHVHSRVEEIWDALDFVEEATRVPDRATAFQLSQFAAGSERGEANPLSNPYEYAGKWTLEDVEAIATDAEGILAATDVLDAFARFSDLEERIEPIESEVYALVSEVDSAIQLEIDRRRGK